MAAGSREASSLKTLTSPPAFLQVSTSSRPTGQSRMQRSYAFTQSAGSSLYWPTRKGLPHMVGRATLTAARGSRQPFFRLSRMRFGWPRTARGRGIVSLSRRHWDVEAMCEQRRGRCVVSRQAVQRTITLEPQPVTIHRSSNGSGSVCHIRQRWDADRVP
jgi:hypothetical protein